MIEVSNLTFEYPNQLALDDVSFRIERNTITALVGPNGAGKTTLLKCLSALLIPNTGNIKIDGHDIIKDPRSVNPLIGYMPDFFGLYDNLTVYQAMHYFAMAYDVKTNKMDERIRETLDSVNLLNKIDDKIGALSRGMRQRMALAQSIIHQPKILFLDEPASGLDPEARKSLTELFLSLNKKDMTIVVSSHILSELDDYATHLIALKNGKIVEKSVGKSEVTDEKVLFISTLNSFATYIPLIEEGNDFTIASHEDNTAEIILKGDDNSLHELLKRLINSGVQVNEFYVKKSKLQDHYINLMK